MAETITKLRVTGKQAAIDIVNRIALKYRLKPGDPDNILDQSSADLHVYYDSDESVVVVERNEAGTTEEYLKEFLMDFPTLF